MSMDFLTTNHDVVSQSQIHIIGTSSQVALGNLKVHHIGDVGWILGSRYTDGNLWCYVPGLLQFSREIISWPGFCKWLQTMYKLYNYKVSNLAVHANWVQRAWLIHNYSCSFCLKVLSCHKTFHGMHGRQTLHALAKLSSQLIFFAFS